MPISELLLHRAVLIYPASGGHTSRISPARIPLTPPAGQMRTPTRVRSRSDPQRRWSRLSLTNHTLLRDHWSGSRAGAARRARRESGLHCAKPAASWSQGRLFVFFWGCCCTPTWNFASPILSLNSQGFYSSGMAIAGKINVFPCKSKTSMLVLKVKQWQNGQCELSVRALTHPVKV